MCMVSAFGTYRSHLPFSLTVLLYTCSVHAYCIQRHRFALTSLCFSNGCLQVWMDPAASPNSLFPMINDLDLTFVDANGTVRYSNGRTSPDTSNNVEQITGMARYNRSSIRLISIMSSIPLLRVLASLLSRKSQTLLALLQSLLSLSVSGLSLFEARR
jgi:hypothetical protein